MFDTLRLPVPTLSEIFAGPLAKRGEWVVACVLTDWGWPAKVEEIVFRERSIFMLPMARTEGDNPTNSYPAVAIELSEGEAFEAGQVIISHFLSSLTWVGGRAIRVNDWSGGNIPRPTVGFTGPRSVVRDFYCPYLPDPQGRNERLALAFYREGLGLNEVAYQCLSFFKVLNIFLRTGKAQEAWISAAIPLIKGYGTEPRIQQLRNAGEDIGRYLYGSNRCAVAHAGGDPTADPEDPKDLRRLRDDLPVVKALAEFAIEHHFGIKSSMTVYREHLYELAGFKPIFGNDRLAKLIDVGLTAEEWPAIPRLSIRLAYHEPTPALQAMNARVVQSGAGHAWVLCSSQDGYTEIPIRLNFGEERLQLDLNFRMRDDGTEAFARHVATLQQFNLDYTMNGILEVWDADASQLLGRCDANLPLNIDPGATHDNFEKMIADTLAEADRRASEKRDGAPQL